MEATVGFEPTTYCLGVHLKHDFENRSIKVKVAISAWLSCIITSFLFSLVSCFFGHLRKQNGNGLFTTSRWTPMAGYYSRLKPGEMGHQKRSERF